MDRTTSPRGPFFALFLALLLPLHTQAVAHACGYFNMTTCVHETTNFALKNYLVCPFSSCGNSVVTVTTLSGSIPSASCEGDTFLRLLETSSQELLAVNDDANEATKCSEMRYSVPEGYDCKDLEVHIGCSGEEECQAQAMIDVSETRPVYVHDTVSNISGNSWELNCMPFNVSAMEDKNSVLEYDPAKTAVCSFEACPGQYYSVELTDCSSGARTEAFSYGEGDVENDFVTSANCGYVSYFDGLGSDQNGPCRLVSMYQTCKEDEAINGYCSGQTIVTARKYPIVDVQWVDDLLATPGHPIRYVITNFTTEDKNYFDSNASNLYVAVYKYDMLQHQEECEYSSYDGTDSANFFDYIDYVNWDGVGGTTYVTSNSGSERYIVSDFGGVYELVVWLWKTSKSGVGSAYSLASTGRLRVGTSSSVTLSISRGSSGEYVSGTWEFSQQASSVAGDQVVLYELNDEGVCHVQHDHLKYTDALWNQEITIAGEVTGEFSTEVGANSFRLPDEESVECTRTRMYEVRYIRNGEVISRSVVLPMAANPSAAPTTLPDPDCCQSGQDHTLEYALLITAIVLAVIGALAYAVRYQLSPSELTLERGNKYKRGGFEALSLQNSSGDQEDIINDVDIETINPSFFQIELADDDADDDSIF